ncbi:hypothetical protein [Sabulicella glaciei]|uniref:Uncharacterized protein n=1 Tax=Sabulicella glaciei TaxID=2984948 RepID=A0ABT3NZY0_9PROT|nr:hypothetical protein [Roseococcus sp. MDT2-1-1]MCW8087691.1 hypothetical protein [Roseococcus sp. MDT2-1-1]
MSVPRREADQYTPGASNQIMLVQSWQQALEVQQAQVRSEVAAFRTRIGGQITATVVSDLDLP